MHSFGVLNPLKVVERLGPGSSPMDRTKQNPHLWWGFVLWALLDSNQGPPGYEWRKGKNQVFREGQ